MIVLTIQNTQTEMTFDILQKISREMTERLKAKHPKQDILHYCHFDGPVYEEKFDRERLTGQIKRVYNVMRHGYWLTLDEINGATGDPHASISAQLRHLRKPRFGSHTIEKRPRGDRSNGLWEYRMPPPDA